MKYVKNYYDEIVMSYVCSEKVPAGTGSIFIAQPNEAFTMGDFGTSLDSEPVFRSTEFRWYPRLHRRVGAAANRDALKPSRDSWD